MGLMGCNGCFMSVNRDGEVLCSSKEAGEQGILQVSGVNGACTLRAGIERNVCSLA